MSGSKNGSNKSGPKVLRIGVVQGGKIIEERELKKRETVSVGTADKATFTINSEALPKSFDLFDYDGKDYYLRFNAKMDARVQTAGNNEAISFDKLRKQGKVVKRGDTEAVKLSDNSRGKVMVGDVTVLFQFKARAAAPVRPVLPAEIRGSLLQNIDTQFTLIFVMVAINHPFTLWMLHSFFLNIPKDMDESAMVDGCTRFQAFRMVIVPVMWPGVITTGLFSFLLAYNDFAVTTMLLSESNRTMVPAIAAFLGTTQTEGNVMFAVASVVSATVPLFILVMFFQRQIVSGLTAGAVKG